MNKLALLLAIVVTQFNLVAADFAPTPRSTVVAEHLQTISVTIRAENGWSAGEGSGVIFTRKNANGDLVNFVWTAAHVVDNLRTERRVIVKGSPRTLVEFKDAKIIKVIRQNGRSVGRLELDAEVIKWSDADDGHDLALLRVRKLNFITDSAKFYLDDKTPPLGTDLWHVGSLLGQLGANSMTDGIYSQHGRIIPELNKLIFDQTTVAAFPGSSGGGVFLAAVSLNGGGGECARLEAAAFARVDLAQYTFRGVDQGA